MHAKLVIREHATPETQTECKTVRKSVAAKATHTYNIYLPTINLVICMGLQVAAAAVVVIISIIISSIDILWVPCFFEGRIYGCDLSTWYVATA